MALDLVGLAQSLLGGLSSPTKTSSSVIGGSDENDMAQIQSILSTLQAPEQKPGLIETLSTVIPEAIAAYLNPAALPEQLKNRQDRIERAKERKDRVNQLGAQLKIEDILSRGKERRAEQIAIRTEERQGKRELGAEFRATQRDIAKFNRESGFQEKMQNLSFEQNQKLAETRFGFEKDLAKINNTYATDLEKLRSSNNITEQKIGNELGFVLPLLYSGHFTGKQAANIYDKIARNEKLSPEEDKLISKANKSLRDEKYRHDLALAHAQKSQSGDSLYGKAIQWASDRADKSDLGQDAQGNIHNLQKDMLGNLTGPPGVQITKYLNEDEQFHYYIQRNPITNLAKIGQQTTFDVPDDKAVALSIDDAIKVARDERRSDAEIAQRLNDPAVQQRLKATPQQIQDALSRNKINPQSNSIKQGAEGTADDILLSLERGDTSAISAAQKDVEAKGVRFQAAKTVNYLINQLRLAKESDKQRPSEFLKNTIKDIEKRLEYAYNQNPELRPK
jgi:hypothetical protein